jgi:dynein heavy chain, axonemal
MPREEWTENVTSSFEELGNGSENSMKECHKLIEGRINSLINKVRGDLKKLERMKIINIITIDVHGRDVVESFVSKKVMEAESFAWLSQLKFFYECKSDSDMHTR